MPSDCVVPVAAVDEVLPHPNADRLELARILGWQVVVQRGTYHPGSEVVYVPPDNVVPPAVSDPLDVTKYLSNGRVRQIKLRGEPSFGFAFEPDAFDVLANAKVGDNVADALGITKYSPPVREISDAERDNALFPRYTTIQNLRNYPTLFEIGELVDVTEKIHGTNCRVGVVAGEYMAGSHALRRKRPENDAFGRNVYWYPLSLGPVKDLLDDLSVNYRQVVLYGEVYGRVQKLHYGLPKDVAFAAFDLLLDGHYVDPADFLAYMLMHGVPVVPGVYGGPWQGMDHLVSIVPRTTLVRGGDNTCEGVVIRPQHGGTDPKIGRRILKYVSDAYLFGGVDEAGPDDVESTL